MTSRKIVEILILAGIYILSAKIGQIFAVGPGNITPVWFPSGIVFFIILWRGYHLLPGVFLGAVIGNGWAYISFEDYEKIIRTLSAAVLNGIGDTLYALLGVYYVKKVSTINNLFISLKSLTTFILFAVIIGSLVSAIFGVTGLFLSDLITSNEYWTLFITWFIGDTVGVLLFAPLLIVLLQNKWNLKFSPKLILYYSLLVIIIFLIPYIPVVNHDTLHILIIVIPIAIYIAFRIDQLSALFFATLVSISILFSQALSDKSTDIDELNKVLISTQLFIFLLFTILLFFILLINRLHTEGNKRNALIISHERIALSTIHNGIGIWDWNLENMELVWDDSMFQLYNMRREDFNGGFDAWQKSLHPDDKEYAEEEISLTLEGKKDLDTEFRVIWPNGEIHYIKSVAKTFFDDKGKPLRMLGTNIDNTKHKLAEEELHIAATTFESQEGIFVTDPNGIILKSNKAFSQMTGYTDEEIIGKNPRIFQSGRHDIEFYTSMWKQIQIEEGWSGEIWNRRKNGNLFAEQLTITAVKKDNKITHYVATMTDITTKLETSEEIRKLAFYDTLTNLPNRRLLLDRLKHALSSSERNKRFGALLFLDIDHFKTLNDTLGHNIGDLLLEQVSGRLASSVRKNDSVARFGGDEFVILLESLSTDVDDAASQTLSITDKVLSSIREPYQLGPHHHVITISIGVTLFHGCDTPIEELLKQADIAMYQAKEQGRDTMTFFDLEMQKKLTNRVRREGELRDALKKEEFQLYYQVQVNTEGKPYGAEALIRWFHPEHGMVPPLDFIPLAEDTDLILPIGQWILDTACAQLKHWEHNKYMCHLTLSVNVSVKQFRQIDFVEQVIATVTRHGINPKLLRFELVESLLLENIDEVIDSIRVLKGIGIKFELDDFGTGYSSLQYLKKLPLDQLKIDQSFVQDIATDKNDRAIVLTIITTAHSIGMEVIAEGVETKEQRDFLVENGCENIQGYFYSKPVPADEFENILKDGFK